MKKYKLIKEHKKSVDEKDQVLSDNE